ncbi:MAG TPA: tetratricopeptide repeat protein, partial [Terriglobia bacterium]|nr:tetratricopeptide repeat protein [Terriglobia bacterium]
MKFCSVIFRPAGFALVLMAALTLLPARSLCQQGAASPRSRSGASAALGRSEANTGNCGEAEKAFSKLAAPGAAEAFTLGRCYFRLRDFTQAIPHLEKAARLSPRDEHARIFLARAYAGEGRSEQAISSLNAWIKEHGEDSKALYWIGNFYEDLANTTFQQMAAKNPGSYLVYEMKGGQDVARQQYPQALAAYKKALALAPTGTPGLHFHLGDVYWRMLRYQGAKKELKQELELNPYHAQANYELGSIEIKEGNSQQAITYLEKAIALDPALTEAHRALGRAYLDEKRYPQAIQEFQLVAKAEPSDHTIHAMLAGAYRLTGRMEEAKQEAQKSQELERQTIQQIQANKAAEK